MTIVIASVRPGTVLLGLFLLHLTTQPTTSPPTIAEISPQAVAQIKKQPPQQATNSHCEDFARSGGYPILSGGTYGPNQGIEQLPGMPPLIFGPFDGEIQRHLLEEDYLRAWCLRNM